MDWLRVRNIEPVRYMFPGRVHGRHLLVGSQFRRWGLLSIVPTQLHTRAASLALSQIQRSFNSRDP